MKYVLVCLTLLLAIAHQDFWWWDDKTVLFGFLPIGLAWHSGISLAAGILGLVAVTLCWPDGLEEAGAPAHESPREQAGDQDGGRS